MRRVVQRAALPGERGCRGVAGRQIGTVGTLCLFPIRPAGRGLDERSDTVLQLAHDRADNLIQLLPFISCQQDRQPLLLQPLLEAHLPVCRPYQFVGQPLEKDLGAHPPPTRDVLVLSHKALSIQRSQFRPQIGRQ